MFQLPQQKQNSSPQQNVNKMPGEGGGGEVGGCWVLGGAGGGGGGGLAGCFLQLFLPMLALAIYVLYSLPKVAEHKVYIPS